MATPAEFSPPKSIARVGGGGWSPRARGAEWTVGVAACVLLVISLSGWLYHRTQLADIVANHLRLQVTGPAKLRPGMDNQYTVVTTSVTGEPISAQVKFAVYPPGDQRPMRHSEKTDEQGRLTVTIPAGLDVSAGARLEVSASHDGRQEKVVARLAAEPVSYVTYLALDKPLYRPGETVQYRSLTLSRFRLRAEREMPIRFEILDPGGAPVAGSQWDGATRQGLAGGRFRIPEALAGGRYTLVARSLEGMFPEEQRTFFIRHYRLPRLNQQLEFTHASYAPGDRVVAELSVWRADGRAAAGARLNVAATLDGEPLYEATAEASSHGTLRVEFLLPEQIERGEGYLTVVADDGGFRETIVKTIPIRLGEVEVGFHPEGGELVAELENRVYFTARDPLGKPVQIRGRIIDSQGRQVAGAATTRKGIGAFSIIPSPGKQYRLVLANSSGTHQVVNLPRSSTRHKVVLSTGLGVFPEGKPLEFNVRASEAGLPLVASAWCRGVPVGQRAFVTNQGAEANSVVVPLDPEAGGVIQLTIYDYSVSPPEPVAQRLVYRSPARRLQVVVGQASEAYSPGEAINVSLLANDEEANPVSATLGVSVVPDALLSLAQSDTPAMPIHFLLATEVQSADDLGDPDVYLSESREAAVALDLLLGTQGWRRFLGSALHQLGEETPEHRPLGRLAALGGEASPPAMFDNLIELHQRYQKSLATYQANRTWASNTLTALSFFGGVGLVMLVAMLNVLNIAGGARLWAPAIGAATVCLIVGGILMDPGRWKSPPEGAVPYVPFDMAPAALPKAGHATGNSQRDTTGASEGNKHRQGAEDAGGDPDEAIPGLVRSDSLGRARVRIAPSGRSGSFRVLVDGYAEGGRLGSGSGQLVVRLPFKLEPRLPLEVSPGDRVDLPVAIVNNTDAKLPVELALECGDLLELDGEPRRNLEVEPDQRAREYFPLRVIGQGGRCELKFHAAAGQLADDVTCSLKVVPAGGPRPSPSADPIDEDACPVRLSTRLDRNKVPWGHTVALVAELANATSDAQPMAVAILGLPAGLEVCYEQLDQLRKLGKIDYYETRPREVICYWRALQPGEKVDLKLNLIATVPGRFTGPASRAYLSDAAERKQWNKPLVVEITPEMSNPTKTRPES